MRHGGHSHHLLDLSKSLDGCRTKLRRQRPHFLQGSAHVWLAAASSSSISVAAAGRTTEASRTTEATGMTLLRYCSEGVEPVRGDNQTIVLPKLGVTPKRGR